MRTPNIGTVQFSPGIVPTDPRDLTRYIQDLEVRIQTVIALLAIGHLDVTYVAPERPRVGDIRMADGSSWNPGAGVGVYAYYNNVWNKLG